MKHKHYAIVMPGLGDHRESLEWLTANWEEDFKITPVIHLAGWGIKGRTYDEMLADLHQLIRKLRAGGNTISLLGASASGSLAFNGLIAFPEEVSSAVSLCGRLKVGREKGIRSFKSRAESVPAFANSVRHFESNIPKLTPKLKQRMLITKGWFDELVPEEAMIIGGISSIRIPFIEHLVNISLSLATNPFLGNLAKGKEVIDFIKKGGH